MLPDISVSNQRGDVLLLFKAAAFVAESAEACRDSPTSNVGLSHSKQADDDTSTTVSTSSLGSNAWSQDHPESNNRVRMLIEAAVALDVLPEPPPVKKRPNKKIKTTRKARTPAKSKARADLAKGGRLQKKSPAKRNKVAKAPKGVARISSKTREKTTKKKNKKHLLVAHPQESVVDLATCDGSDDCGSDAAEGALLQLSDASSDAKADRLRRQIMETTAGLQDREEANEKLRKDIREMEGRNSEIKQWCSSHQSSIPPPATQATSDPSLGLLDLLVRHEKQRQPQTQSNSETLSQLQLLLNLALVGQAQHHAPTHTIPSAYQALLSGTTGMSSAQASTPSHAAPSYSAASITSYGGQAMASAPMSIHPQGGSSLSLQDALCHYFSPTSLDPSQTVSAILQQRPTDLGLNIPPSKPVQDTQTAFLSAMVLNALESNQQPDPAHAWVHRPSVEATSLQKQVNDYQVQQQHQAQALYAVLQNLAAR